LPDTNLVLSVQDVVHAFMISLIDVHAVIRRLEDKVYAVNSSEMTSFTLVDYV
jgi:hypothetical protein